ncbi:MAG: capsular biosynthesis protein, partial [Actinobacteria bacterium]|nr:capsular biosynthesis protein [Actinomycetota bacterium]
MDLASFGRALRKRWWYVVVAVVLGTAISTVLTLRSPKEYASSVTFFVSTPGSANGTALQADQFAQLRVNSYVNLLSSEQLAKLVLTQPGVGDLTPKQVISTITATAPSNTVVLTATVTDTLPRRSLAIAGAIGATFPGMVNSLDPPSSRTVLKVVSGPTLNTTPVSPRKTLDIGLGVLIGLAIGLAVTFLRELIDKTMRTPQDLEAASGLAVLGSVAFDKAVRTEPLIVGARH